jgi:hypothetical protein
VQGAKRGAALNRARFLSQVPLSRTQRLLALRAVRISA